MNDPRVLIVFSLVFVLLGLYNVYRGLRRMREAQARGQRVIWYKQINMLIGIEYILLSLVFLLSIATRSKILPSSLSGIIAPFYLVVLLAAAVLATLVIRQGIANSRRPSGQSSAQTAKSNGTSTVTTDDELTPEQRAANLARRRERRRNAASARRRRSGRA